MAHPTDFGAGIEQDAHEGPTTEPDPVRPGRYGVALLVLGGLFLLVVAFFFYALAGA